MPRPSAVLSMSLDDLQRVIRDRQRALAKLERKRAKLQRKLDDLDRHIAHVSGSARGGRGSRPRNEMSLSEAIAQVLGRAGGALRVRDIAEKVQALGYRSGSANFRGMVNIALIKEKRFKSAGRGVYQLDGATAGVRKRGNGKRKTRRKAKRKKAL